jgi:hypothetical protein
MKRKLTKAEWEALSPELKLFYVADGDNFKLVLTGEDEDNGPLVRALAREKEEKRIAKEKADALQADLDAMKLDPARKSGDIKTLEASWQQKLDAQKAVDTAKITALTGTLNKTLVESAANKIAGAITGSPENASLMLPHILTRLEVVYDGDVPTVKVKDKDGRVSAMNFDELQKEFVATPTFATVVVGSKASGAGGSGGSGANGGAATGPNKKEFGKLTGPEKVDWFKSDPKGFQQAADDFQKQQNAIRFSPTR